jgi:hypothetical protein
MNGLNMLKTKYGGGSMDEFWELIYRIRRLKALEYEIDQIIDAMTGEEDEDR